MNEASKETTTFRGSCRQCKGIIDSRPPAIQGCAGCGKPLPYDTDGRPSGWSFVTVTKYTRLSVTKTNIWYCAKCKLDVQPTQLALGDHK